MMTPDEEAYGEAMRRIQGAEQTRAAQLRGFRFLKWLPPELERADAALFGDLILFSPNFWGVDGALEATGPLKGKTVVVTNPLEWNPNGRMLLSLSGSTTAGEELAKKLPGAHVVKAFSTIPASLIPHAFYRPGQLQRLVVFYCGDHRISKVSVHQLIADSGFVGVDAGPTLAAAGISSKRTLLTYTLIGSRQRERAGKGYDRIDLPDRTSEGAFDTLKGVGVRLAMGRWKGPERH